MSLNRVLVALQYGQYDLLKTARAVSVSTWKVKSKSFEHTNSVVVNDALGLGLCCGHGSWIHARAEEFA